MKPFALLARSPLFTGLSPAELDELGPRLQPRSLEPGQELCRAGEPGDSLFVIEAGLAHVLIDDRVVAKLRRGDVVGEMSLLTGEPRSATVVAAVPTEVLELRQRDFAEAIGRSPVLLKNLNRILSQKLAATTAQVGAERTRGEAVALIAGRGIDLNEVVEATRAAKVGSVAVLDGSSIPNALAQLDDLLGEHATVLVTAELGQERLEALVRAVDRTVCLEHDEALEAAGAEIVATDDVALARPPPRAHEARSRPRRRRREGLRPRERAARARAGRLHRRLRRRAAASARSSALSSASARARTRSRRRCAVASARRTSPRSSSSRSRARRAGSR